MVQLPQRIMPRDVLSATAHRFKGYVSRHSASLHAYADCLHCLQGNSSVEAVVCLQSLHTLPDLPRFLAETQRVLKPGAPFIFLQAGLSAFSALPWFL